MPFKVRQLILVLGELLDMKGNGHSMRVATLAGYGCINVRVGVNPQKRGLRLCGKMTVNRAQTYGVVPAESEAHSPMFNGPANEFRELHATNRIAINYLEILDDFPWMQVC